MYGHEFSHLRPTIPSRLDRQDARTGAPHLRQAARHLLQKGLDHQRTVVLAYDSDTGCLPSLRSWRPDSMRHNQGACNDCLPKSRQRYNFVTNNFSNALYFYDILTSLTFGMYVEHVAGNGLLT